MGKLIALLALLGAIAFAAGVGWILWTSRVDQHQLARSEQQAGTATVAAGLAQAATSAAAVVTAGQGRDRGALQQHETNHAEILRAPGADQVLDPGLMRRLRHGLCEYRAYRDDPGCAGLREPDPALVPDPGRADAPPA